MNINITWYRFGYCKYDRFISVDTKGRWVFFRFYDYYRKTTMNLHTSSLFLKKISDEYVSYEFYYKYLKTEDYQIHRLINNNPIKLRGMYLPTIKYLKYKDYNNFIDRRFEKSTRSSKRK